MQNAAFLLSTKTQIPRKYATPAKPVTEPEIEPKVEPEVEKAKGARRSLNVLLNDSLEETFTGENYTINDKYTGNDSLEATYIQNESEALESTFSKETDVLEGTFTDASDNTFTEEIKDQENTFEITGDLENTMEPVTD